MTRSNVAAEAELRLAYALGAFLWWGFVPIYFRQVRDVPALVVLAHRVAWSFVLLGAFVTARSKWHDLRASVGDRRTLGMLGVSTILLACNWGVFIYSVESERVVQAS